MTSPQHPGPTPACLGIARMYAREQAVREWCNGQPEARIEGKHTMHAPGALSPVVLVVTCVLIGRTINYRTRVEW